MQTLDEDMVTIVYILSWCIFPGNLTNDFADLVSIMEQRGLQAALGTEPQILVRFLSCSHLDY